MPWVERDGQNNIVGVYARRQVGVADEYLAEDGPDMVAHATPSVADVKAAIEDEAERRCTLIVRHQSRRVLKLRGNANDTDLVAMESIWAKAEDLKVAVTSMTDQQRRDLDITADSNWQ